jgi:hypothetical protein
MLPSVASGVLLAGCLLLAVSGFAKLHAPQPAAAALRAAGLPHAPAAVRVLGVAELATAGAGVALGPAGAAAVAVTYAALAAFAAHLLRRAPGADCGCLGRAGTGVTRGHVVLDASLALGAALSTLGDGLWEVARNQPLHGAPFAVLALVTARLAALVITDLAALSARPTQAVHR